MTEVIETSRPPLRVERWLTGDKLEELPGMERLAMGMLLVRSRLRSLQQPVVRCRLHAPMQLGAVLTGLQLLPPPAAKIFVPRDELLIEVDMISVWVRTFVLESKGVVLTYAVESPDGPGEFSL